MSDSLKLRRELAEKEAAVQALVRKPLMRRYPLLVDLTMCLCRFPVCARSTVKSVS